MNPILKLYESLLMKEVKRGKIPKHLAIIMDGNRRYAKRRGLPVYVGHMMGSRKVEEVLNWCWEIGIRNVTLYAFSTENFRRSEEEKTKLFQLLEKELRRIARDRRIHRNKVKINVVGKLELLPENVREAIKIAEESTKNYSNFHLNVAVAYGGRQEILDAVREVLKRVERGEIDPEEISEEHINSFLYGGGDYSKVDLVIRTGGEQRLSNFLPWQAANSTAYFCDVYWPQFRKVDLLRAIRTWQWRQRAGGSNGNIDGGINPNDLKGAKVSKNAASEG
jgi:tritrans,polycis-undecaprenyl-diphosphate synthase [geranylgeranyl-diphosphate specific]